MARDLSLFLGQLIRKPDQVVSLAPSSEALARAMCAAIGPETGSVVELGPGTGKITRAILARGIAPADLSAFELNPTFVDILRAGFPSIDLHHAPAQEMARLTQRNFGAVISGLPLLSMPLPVQRAIVGAAFTVMKPDGIFVQFTYGPNPPVAANLRTELGLTWERSAKIWGNLPPARVYTFRRTII